MISHQPKNQTLHDCSVDLQLPWVGANQCNCSAGAPGTEATHLRPEAPMANFIGRSKIYLPYYHYHTPLDSYPISVLAGDNLSFPKRGACNETQSLGDDGCTWKRLPNSRMLYGSDFLAHGWNTSDPNGGFGSQGSVEYEIELTMGNIAVFDRALDSLDRMLTPRCCGC